MTSISYLRGNKIEYNSKWVYSDTKESISKGRHCVRCGLMPTKEGYDHCLGYIKGLKSACCGHGVTDKIRK
jgi:hypothetical protein